MHFLAWCDRSIKGLAWAARTTGSQPHTHGGRSRGKKVSEIWSWIIKTPEIRFKIEGKQPHLFQNTSHIILQILSLRVGGLGDISKGRANSDLVLIGNSHPAHWSWSLSASMCEPEHCERRPWLKSPEFTFFCFGERNSDFSEMMNLSTENLFDGGWLICRQNQASSGAKSQFLHGTSPLHLQTLGKIHIRNALHRINDFGLKVDETLL